MGSEPEAEVLARCLRGEPAAWDELFDRHYQAASRFIFQLGHDFTAEDVEEICQDTFLAVIRNLASFKGGCQLQTWVFRIAANKARDFRERRMAAKRGGGQPMVSLQAENPDSGLTVDPPAPVDAPDDALLKAEQVAFVAEGLRLLGEPCREIIELRYFGDLSYEEISGALALNPKTVSSRLSKCLDKLELILRQVFSRGNPQVSPSNI
jgi:RNA polymerase sigma-70 factor (ECF subfamily)